MREQINRFNSADFYEQSDNFSKWFSKSKIIDKYGLPAVMYHGTSKSFSTFNITEQGVFGSGIYLASTTEQAVEFAMGEEGGDNLMPVYVSLQRPFLTEASYDFGDAYDIDSPAVRLVLDVFGEDAPQEIERMRGVDFANLGANVRERLLEMGHDGIIAYYDDGTFEVVAFMQNQVKSAIGNNGDYSAMNNDITR